MPGADFRGTSGEEGKGFVTADGYSFTVTDITFDPPSLGTMAGAVSSDIDVVGVQVGDAIELFPPYDTKGIIFQGFVTVADKIKISLFNPTAGTIDLDSGAWGVAVKRRA